ncbi:MAG: hypothetical protein GTN81_04785 [Proteobacteria bacterium]|nr:hypothetical protein [Pseudomonadota bacterium]
MRRKPLAVILFLFLFSFLIVPITWGSDACKSIAGTWTFVEKLTKTSCTDEWVGKRYTETVTFEQRGCIATVPATRLKFDMNTGAISGSYPEQDGTTKIKSGSLNLNTYRGSWTWIFRSPGENCRGASVIELKR